MYVYYTCQKSFYRCVWVAPFNLAHIAVDPPLLSIGIRKSISELNFNGSEVFVCHP